MGEVYRARDTRLDRNVALKVLPQAFTRDAERLARFDREAKVLASLNHPGIATIHGIEECDGVRALVLEFVEGGTLADRLIVKRTLPVDEALDVARQIADALDAAHERGIVHRDLKPSNVGLTSSGVVKVLDFGVAKTQSTQLSFVTCRRRSRHDPREPRRRDARGPRARHGRVHEPGAGARPGGGQADRHLGVRLRRLRDADWCSRRSAVRRCRIRWPRSSSRTRLAGAVRRAFRRTCVVSSSAVCRRTCGAGCVTSATRMTISCRRRRGEAARREPCRAARTSISSGSPTKSGSTSRRRSLPTARWSRLSPTVNGKTAGLDSAADRRRAASGDERRSRSSASAMGA